MERGRTLPPEPLDQESIPPGGQPPAATPLGMLQREHGLKAATHLHEGALGIWELSLNPKLPQPQLSLPRSQAGQQGWPLTSCPVLAVGAQQYLTAQPLCSGGRELQPPSPTRGCV